MSDSGPQAVLDDLEDNDEECVRLHSPAAYLWYDTERDKYVLLEQSSTGSWYPRGRPVSAARAEHAIESAGSVDIEPATKLPPGRHRIDR